MGAIGRNDESMEGQPAFKSKTIEKLVKQHLSSDVSISASAAALTAELLRLFTVEALRRAVALRDAEASSGGGAVSVEHIKDVLPQLLLDF